MKIITINPNTDNQTSSFIPQRMLHSLEFEQVLSILEKSVNDALEYKPLQKDQFKRVHNTITLSGSRGSGKTSFLMSLKSNIETSNELNKMFIFLDIIDPTLIEEKGHIFLNIVARIKSLIDNQIDEGELPLTSELYSNWEKSLKKYYC